MLPTDIHLHKKSNTLEVTFQDGTSGTLSAEFLRVNSPSAEVQGHGNPILQTGKRHVRLTGMEPIGNYAVRLIFDDGHDSGLFHWETLHTFIRDHDALWQDYLNRLKAAGASRDPATSGGAVGFDPERPQN